MTFKKAFLGGFGMACLLWVGCAAIQYRSYGLSLPDGCYSQGVLLGKLGQGGWPDIPFDQCKPDQVVKGKCVIQLTGDYFAKDQELLQCRESLSKCQEGTAVQQ